VRLRAVLILPVIATALIACREEVDVNVHGIPDEIRLGLPFCVPPPTSDAAPDADVAADATDDGP
jgi:hypothetical protein